jgi:dTDP-glucose pyrophosphorylase/predicted transcriptional regulator
LLKPLSPGRTNSIDMKKPLPPWTETLVPPTAPIRDALVIMGKTRRQIALVVDQDNRLVGTVTDGDVRRGILNDISSERPVSEIMHSTPSTTSTDITRADQILLMRTKHIHQLPVVDDNRHVIGLVTMGELIEHGATGKPNMAVLLVGGLGSRLRPLTDNKPKPLIAVGGRPVLETIVRQLRDHGIRHMYFAVKYMADAIKEHFGDGGDLGVRIDYLEESTPLGTAGALGLLSETPDVPFIVMNGDILTNVNFSELLTYHEAQDAAATVTTRTFEIEIPFGVVENIEHQIKSIEEKPLRQFQVNAGIYVFAPDVLNQINPNQHLDMPDLLTTLIGSDATVASFPIHEYWIDIGRLEDLNQASNEFADVFS